MYFITCLQCPAKIRRNKTGLCLTCYKRRDDVTIRVGVGSQVPVDHAAQLAADRQKARQSTELSNLRHVYQEALKTIHQQEQELRSMNVIGQGQDVFEIRPRMGTGTSEGTAVIVASDWHIEERVGAEVGGLNENNIELAKGKAIQFFEAAQNLVELLQARIRIDRIVLALLGDFISNDIHEGENAESNELTPMYAIQQAQNFLISGIQFLLDYTKAELVIPCHSGNHARTTKKIRFAAENGHSLEYLMYLHLAAYFRNEPRVTFIIPEGMHSYLKVYDTTIRFHHGHAVKYGGGVGGIYIPVNKAIAQWNKGRHADLDVFGHFHQLRDGGNFLCNGSLIGYNAFALSIKADYEKPKQLLFLMDKKRGRTATWPILVN